MGLCFINSCILVEPSFSETSKSQTWSSIFFRSHIIIFSTFFYFLTDPCNMFYTILSAKFNSFSFPFFTSSILSIGISRFFLSPYISILEHELLLLASYMELFIESKLYLKNWFRPPTVVKFCAEIPGGITPSFNTVSSLLSLSNSNSLFRFVELYYPLLDLWLLVLKLRSSGTTVLISTLRTSSS